MTTNQIYGLVNAVNSEAFGSAAVAVVDTSTLISLGTTVLSSSTNTEGFLNALAQRIGRTILRYREYRNKLGDMVINDFEYGAILQKIKVEMPDAEADESYGLTDGSSVDMYKVAKPSVKQKLFVTRTPYQYKVTIQTKNLKEAFLSAEAMGAFISAVYGEVRNAIEVGLENLARVTLATAIAETSGTGRLINLKTAYTAAGGTAPATLAEALRTENFLRFAIQTINNYIDAFQDMSAAYNDGTVETFTNRDNLRLRVLSSFQRALETQVEYAAFHEQFVRPDADYLTRLTFWQGQQTPEKVMIKRPSDATNTTVNGVLALLHDRDAMGVYKFDEYVSTTPENSAGLYRNTYYHEQQLRFIDPSENFVVFNYAS